MLLASHRRIVRLRHVQRHLSLDILQGSVASLSRARRTEEVRCSPVMASGASVRNFFRVLIVPLIQTDSSRLENMLEASSSKALPLL